MWYALCAQNSFEPEDADFQFVPTSATATRTETVTPGTKVKKKYTRKKAEDSTPKKS